MVIYMNVLVTGGAGFIGSNLTKLLCDKGHKVTVLDDFSSSGRKSTDSRADLVNGSVGNFNLVSKLVKGKDVVFHLAATGIIKLSLENPPLYFENNVMNGVVLLEAMRKNGVKKMVYSSSSGVYGEPKRVPIKESDPKEPINPYGAAKLAFEDVLSAYSSSFGIHSVCLRYYNVYGPGDEQHPVTRAVPSWIQAGLKDEPLNIYWGGKQKKDYIFVGDVARANLMSASKCDGFRVYNVGSGEGIFMNDLALRLEKVFGKKLIMKQAGDRSGDPDILIADITKIKKELGWEPRVGLEEGLGKTIDYYRNKLEQER